MVRSANGSAWREFVGESSISPASEDFSQLQLEQIEKFRMFSQKNVTRNMLRQLTNSARVLFAACNSLGVRGVARPLSSSKKMPVI